MHKHACVTVLTALALAAIASAQSALAFQSGGVTQPKSLSDPQFVVSSKGDCVLLGLKKHLIDGQVTQFYPSPKGKFVLAQRVLLSSDQYFDAFKGKDPNPLKVQVSIVNVASGRSVDFPVDVSKVSIQFLRITDSGFAMILAVNLETTQIISLSPSGKSTIIASTSGTIRPDCIPMGKNGGSLLVINSLTKTGDNPYSWALQSAYILDDQGNVSRDVTRIVGDADSVFPNPKDTSTLFIYKAKKWYLMSLSSGARTPIERPDLATIFDEAESSLPPLRCYPGGQDKDKLWRLYFDEAEYNVPTAVPANATGLSTQPTPKEKPKAKPESAVVGANLTSAILSPDQTSLFLADSGGLDYVPLQPVDLATYNLLMKNKAKQEALSKAKQVGTAMLIYGSDYDDTFPLGNNWSDAVMPYIKNRDMLNDFQYLMNGENMSAISDPAGTELGIVSTPYGEAVVYADGHAKWRDNNPPAGLIISILADPKRYK